MAAAAIDERALEARLYQPAMPPLDLLIRTAGEQRVSNFLLWQLSYAELLVVDTPWPDFREEELEAGARRVRHARAPLRRPGAEVARGDRRRGSGGVEAEGPAGPPHGGAGRARGGARRCSPGMRRTGTSIGTDVVLALFAAGAAYEVARDDGEGRSRRRTSRSRSLRGRVAGGPRALRAGFTGRSRGGCEACCSWAPSSPSSSGTCAPRARATSTGSSRRSCRSSSSATSSGSCASSATAPTAPAASRSSWSRRRRATSAAGSSARRSAGTR